MAFTSLEASAIAPGKPLPYTMLQTIKNNEDYLYGLSGGANSNGNLVYNGEFEIDSDNDGQPDGWTITAHVGGGSTLVTTATTWASPISGGKSLAISRAAGSSAAPAGGAVIRSDYFPISYRDALLVDMKTYSPSGDNWVIGFGFETYTANKTLIETIVPGTGIYNSYGNLQRYYAIISLYKTSWLLSAASSLPKYARIMYNVGTTTDYSTNANSRVLIDSVNVTHFHGMSYSIEMSTQAQISTRATAWESLYNEWYDFPLHNTTLFGEFSFAFSIMIGSSAGTTVYGGDSTQTAYVRLVNNNNRYYSHEFSVSMATTEYFYFSDTIPFAHYSTSGLFNIGKECLVIYSSLSGTTNSRWMTMYQARKATVRIDGVEILYI
jgi:hypothetical protein